MLKRSICAMFSSCLVLAIGCGSSSPDPIVVPGTGGTTAASTGGATGTSPGTGGAMTQSTGGVTTSNGGSTNATGGASPGAGGSTSQGGSAVGGAATGGAATAGGATATGGKAVGGAATGGAATAGGATAAGGKATGGATTATGGVSTSTGGTSTATGGATAAGGTTVDASGCRVWLATDGNDTNAGTAAAPVATLLHAYDLLCPMVTGSANGAECGGPSPRTLCVKAGTYTMTTRFEFKKTRMGTASNPIIVQADPSATTKPVFDFTTQPRVTSCGANPSDGNLGGFTINADYVTVKNLELKGANDNCIKAQGSNGLLEGVVVHNCADAGIQISSGSGYTGSGTNNAVKNCDSYLNYDPQCQGENADGFAVKEGTGTGNSFSGCRAWDNTDDGWDLYAWTSPVRIENSWAISQTKTNKGTASDGNGFKLGGNSVSAAHVIANLVAVDNNYGSSACGFTENSNPASMSCTGSCYSWGNKTNVDTIDGTISSTAPSGATAASMVAASARNADGSLKAITAL